MPRRRKTEPLRLTNNPDDYIWDEERDVFIFKGNTFEESQLVDLLELSGFDDKTIDNIIDSCVRYSEYDEEDYYDYHD